MKFTMNKIESLEVLAKIQGITGRRNILAIIENILIKACDNQIAIVATDLETVFEGYYSAQIESEGIIVVNAKKLYEITKNFPENDILVNEIENQLIKIGNENIVYRLLCKNPDDFPEIPHIEDVDFFKIDALAFKKMIEKTVILTPPSDEKRVHLHGVYFDKVCNENKNLIKMQSTDNNRLASVEYLFDKDFDLPFEGGRLIPKKSLIEVSKFLDTTGNVRIGFKDNHFIVKNNCETLMARLLDSKFPNFDEVFDLSDGVEKIVLDRYLFLMMLKRMSIFSSDKYNSVTFDFEKDRLIVSVANPELGDAKEDIFINYKGDPMKVSFNPRFFVETINFIESDNIVLNLLDDESPCLIKGEDDNSYKSIIMPMMI